MIDIDESLRPIVAIHQPNFLPWLGYFHKIRWSDVFVLLDDVQIQKTGGSVTNRTALVANGKQIWFTAPIDRTRSGTLRIESVEFASREDFRERLVVLLKQAYAKTPFMKELGDEIVAIVRHPARSLGAYNEAAIRSLATLLGLETRIVLSSTLGVATTSTKRLVDILLELGGRTYLAGAGAKDYQDDGLFFARSINLWGQTFSATYPRGAGEPIPGVSILDALFWLGTKGTRALLDQPLDPAQLRLAKDAAASHEGAP